MNRDVRNGAHTANGNPSSVLDKVYKDSLDTRKDANGRLHASIRCIVDKPDAEDSRERIALNSGSRLSWQYFELYVHRPEL